MQKEEKVFLVAVIKLHISCYLATFAGGGSISGNPS